MKKFGLFIFSILTTIIPYIILIFVDPDLSDYIAKKINIIDFNNKVRTIKNGIDVFSTKVPTKKDINKFYSGTKQQVENLKNNIDNIREGANKIEKTYNDTKEFIEETGEKIENVKETLNNLEQIGDNITNIINTGAIQ